MKPWLPIVAAVVIPGSGHVLLRRPLRGLMMLFWMVLFGAITWNLTTPQISSIGRLAGGLAVWVISVVEVARIVGRNGGQKR